MSNDSVQNQDRGELTVRLRYLLNITSTEEDIVIIFRNETTNDDLLLLQNGFILVCYMLIIIVSLCGNLLVCRTLATQDRSLCSNSTNTLIGVLAVSDLMMTIFNIPFTVVDIIYKDWVFGSFFCTVMSFVQANSVYVSSFTMAVIAVNRWKQIYHFKAKTNSQTVTKQRALVHHEIDDNRSHRCKCFRALTRCFLNRSSSNNNVSVELEHIPIKRPAVTINSNVSLILIILAIWALAAIHSLPHTIFNRVRSVFVVKNPNTITVLNAIDIFTVKRCVSVFPKVFGSNFNLILTLFTSLTQYFIPLSCAGIIYTRIGFTIMAQGKVGEVSKNKAERLSQKKRRRLLMLILLVAIFAFCWLPFNVYYLLIDFHVLKGTNMTVFLACHWLAMSSVCYNPFIYCWLNEHFQKEFKLVFQRIKACITFKSN